MGCKKLNNNLQFETLMGDDDYIGQEKLDGVRAVMHVSPDGSLRFTTRGATLTNPGVPIDITHRLPHFNYKFPHLAGLILDGELLDVDLTSAEVAGILNYKSEKPCSKTIRFFIFDILAMPDRSLLEFPLKHRLTFLGSVFWQNFSNLYPFVHVGAVIGTEAKDNLLNTLFSMGKEGMVLKNMNSLYYPDKKKANTWYKVKKQDTKDVVITGSEPPAQFYRDPISGIYDLDRITKPWGEGWIGSISFSFVEEGKTFLGTCSGITDELKKLFSDGKHAIKPEYVGKIMEVEYMEKTKDGNLRHPRFVRIREEIEK